MFMYAQRETGFMSTVRVLRRWSSTSSSIPACCVAPYTTRSQRP